jgi:ribonuclease HI
MRDKILQVPIINAEFDDELCWKHTPSGQCTTKSAYKTFMEEQSIVAPTSRQGLTQIEIEILMQAWKNAILPPRIKTFAWRLIQRALPSGLRASRFSSHIKKECSRCGLPETDIHLFFHCSFARAVWFTSPLGFRTDSFDPSCYPSNVIQFLLASSHAVVSLQYVFAIMWMIWKARNDLLFNAKRWSLSQVLCAANALLTVGNDEQKILAASKQSHVPSVPMPHPTQPVFSLPAGPIAYCDAAFNPIMDTRTAGLGVYLHNPDRNAKIFIQAVSCTASSVLQAEAHALLLAVRVVHALGWTGVSFLSDNKMLVDAASANDLLSATGHWSIRPVLADVFNRRNQFAERIIKVPRSENKVAHALAKRAFRDHSDSRSLFRCKSNLLSPSLCLCRTSLCNLSYPSGRLLAVHCQAC